MYAIYFLIITTNFDLSGEYVTMNKVFTNVDNVSYVFSPDSSLDVYIDIHPGIKLNNSSILKRVPIHCLDTASDFALAKGDAISFSVGEQNRPLLKIEDMSDNDRVDMRLTHCPICGQPLFYDAITGTHKCINRTCNGQLPHLILMFLSSLGISLQGGHYHIFNTLLSRDKVRSIVDLFMLKWEDIYCDVIAPMDAQVFVQYIHSIRGNVTVDQFLRSLNIPNMSCTTIEQIKQLFDRNQLTLLDLTSFFDPAVTSQYPDIDWRAWFDFIQLDVNKMLIHQLGTILYV